MPVSADIYSGFRPYTFATLADLADATAKRKETESLNAERQSLTAERTMKLAQQQQAAQQAAQRQQLVQSTIQKHLTPDGKLDQEGVLADLQKTDYDAYAEVSKKFDEVHKQALDADKAERERDKAEGDWVSGQLRDTVDHPELYPTVRAQILQKVPKLASVLGETPDPVMIGHIVQANLSNDAYLKSLDAAEKVSDSKEGQVLARLYAAKTPEQVKDAFTMADALGVSRRLAAKGFTPDRYTPDMNRQALMAIPGITPDQLVKLAEPTQAAATGFTLSPGQQRFDAQGNKIASVAPKPVAASGGGAGSGGGGNSDAVQEYAAGLKTGQINITAVPSAGGVRNAVMASLRKDGYDLSRPLTAQTQARVEFSKAVLPQVQQVADMARKIDQMGLMGTVGGRWRQLLASEGSADRISGLTPEQKRLVGQFITQAGLLNSGMAMAHGGARGGGSVQMVAQMEKLLDPKNKDLNTFLGNLDAAQNVLGGYATIKVGNAAEPAATGGGTKMSAEDLLKKYGGK